MIPPFVDLGYPTPWPVLPAGLHRATLDEVEQKFALNERRRTLFGGLCCALSNLGAAGCRKAFLGGSFVTAKPYPSDFDGCWDPTGVDPNKLDETLLDFDNGRARQKAKYLGELFPSMLILNERFTADQFFQIDQFSQKKKGLIQLELS